METLAGKANLSFRNNLLTVTFKEGSRIEVDDVKKMYAYANAQAGGKPFCVLLDGWAGVEFTEDTNEYTATNPDKVPLLARAVVTSDRMVLAKARLYNTYDDPLVKIRIIDKRAEARSWLLEVLANYKGG
jgi:hypothetical protein